MAARDRARAGSGGTTAAAAPVVPGRRQVLRGEATGSGPPLASPVLVVLDLNMPRMKGSEFPAELRSDPALRRLPVFVLTTSDDDPHKAEAYGHHAAGYFVKPHDTERLVEIARFLDDFCNLAEPPSSDAGGAGAGPRPAA